MRHVRRLLAVVFLVLPVVGAAQLVPLTAEFQVNSYTTSTQRYPNVGTDAAGDFVVVWQSYGQDGDRNGIFGQRFNRAGAPLGTEFQVNTYTTGYQERPRVAVGSDGHFLVVWQSEGKDGDGFGIVARRYDSAGSPQGDEFVVNTYTTGDQDLPKIAIAGTGSFVVAWESYDPDNSIEQTVVRRLDASGTPVGSEFVAVPDQSPDSVAADAAGNFVLAWTGFGEEGLNGGIDARRFDSDGNALGTEFHVNTFTTSQQVGASVAMGPTGNFVVIWDSFDQEAPSDTGVYGQRYDSTGAPLGTEFHVNTYTTGSQIRPDVALSPDGDFTVVWQSTEDGSGEGVIARHFRNDGAPDGPPLRLNTFVAGLQGFATIAVQPGHEFVTSWMSQGQDGSLHAIIGRRISTLGDPIGARKLIITTPRGGAAGNRLVFASNDPAVSTPQNVAQDPRCAPAGSGTLASGATLEVSGAGGTFTIALPCLRWTVNGTRTRWKYRDALGPTCRSILVKPGRLRAVCKGAQVAYALGAAQGDVSVVLTLGAPTAPLEQCVTFGTASGAVVVRDGSDGRTYKALNAAATACP